MDHPRARRITGKCSSVVTLLLVIEADLPWDNKQAAEFGENFRAWTEDDFSSFINSISHALPLGCLTLVVPLHSNLLPSGVPLPRANFVREAVDDHIPVQVLDPPLHVEEWYVVFCTQQSFRCLHHWEHESSPSSGDVLCRFQGA